MISWKNYDFYDRIHLVISNLIRFSLLIAIIASAYSQSWNILFISVLVLFITFLPAIIKKNYHLTLPAEFEFVLVIFVYSSLFLGEVYNFYIRYWWWDVLLHAISGITLGIVGFIILYVLYSKDKIKASPFIVALFSFCFAVALGAMWEIFEFGVDNIFNLDMQKAGLVDTMGDLILNSGGAFLASVSGYFYLRYNKGNLIKRLIMKLVLKNPKIFRSKRWKSML